MGPQITGLHGIEGKLLKGSYRTSREGRQREGREGERADGRGGERDRDGKNEALILGDRQGSQRQSSSVSRREVG